MAGAGGGSGSRRDGGGDMFPVRLVRPRDAGVVDVHYARGVLHTARRFGGAQILCNKAAQFKARRIWRRFLFSARHIGDNRQRFYGRAVLSGHHRTVYEQQRKFKAQLHYFRHMCGRIRAFVHFGRHKDVSRSARIHRRSRNCGRQPFRHNNTAHTFRDNHRAYALLPYEPQAFGGACRSRRQQGGA